MIPNIKAPEVVQSIQWIDDHLRIIDQTYLPHREFFLDIFEVGRVWEAIRALRVRGAPAIGIAAAYGVYLGVRDLPEDGIQPFHTDVEGICEYLATSRPTAVNLSWALDRAVRNGAQAWKTSPSHKGQGGVAGTGQIHPRRRQAHLRRHRENRPGADPRRPASSHTATPAAWQPVSTAPPCQ
jgi:hypothetical protein